MRRANGKTFLVLLACVYFCTATFVKIGHIHDLCVSSHSSFYSRHHDSGTDKRSEPVENGQPCLVCLQIAHYVTTINAAPAAPVFEEQPLVFSFIQILKRPQAFCYFFERGPPSLV